MKLNGAQILIETLLEQGTDTVFGYPGGQVLNIYDELYNYSDKIHHVLAAHEQGAAHAADGYARVTGKTGVVIATSGPGATNLVTGIANAFLDSVPLVAITGNVPTPLIGRDSFQEVDIVGITIPITKHNYIVKDVTKLAQTIREAFYIASNGRPGPVLIDIPKDVQIASCEYEHMPVRKPEPPKAPDDGVIEQACKLMKDSRRPFIYCGGGVIAGDAEQQVLRLAELLDCPIGFSMMGLSALPTENPRCLGMVGMHGHYASTKAKAESDLIIAAGVRFSDRATGDKKKYASNASIIHIDIDAAEIDKNIPSDIGINCDIKTTLEAIIVKLEQQKRQNWQLRIAELQSYERDNSAKCIGTLTPYSIVDTVNRYTDADTPIATDVGQHQMWVAQRYNFRNTRTFVTSGGLGTMGFGMGAAIGACVASGKATVLFTGDGSFGMNLNELCTAVSNDLPLIVIIINNNVLGMVRQWQTMFYNKHYSSTTLNRKTDFTALAKAFGASGVRVTTPAEFEKAFSEARKSGGTTVIDCVVDSDERVLPMIPPGGAVDDLILK